jgi:signal transduction histidine kinase
MPLWPRSLFGRLVIILVIGLIVAQLFSLFIHWRDRGRTLNRIGGTEFAHRIVDTVGWLDSVAGAERIRLMRRFSDPRLRVVLTTRYQATTPPDDMDRASALLVERMLRRHLGDDRPLQVLVSERPFRRWQGAGRPPPFAFGDHTEARRPLFFLARVGLQDGAAVDFLFRLPRDALAWPRRLLVSLAVLVLSVILLALVAVRQTTRPLSMLAGAAEELGRDINRPPLRDDEGPTEVRRAAQAFNRMQGQIQRYVKDRTELLAAVSHDLKTPITRLRIRTELLDDTELRASFTADLEEMELMVSETLEFMRGIDRREAGQPVDMTALLESIADDARARGREVDVDVPMLRPYPGQPLALKRCVTNLIDNALKYGRRARLRARDDGATLTIAVHDDGPGIPEMQLERVFEPFYRVEKSRGRDTGGSGLGLAIARNIARGHGGDIVLANAAAGGLVATLTLPRDGESADR